MSTPTKDIHKIRLIPKLMNSTMLFVCQFNDTVTGETISLLDRGKNGIVKVGELEQSDRVKEFPLNVKSVIEFEVDLNDLSNQETKNYVKFWSKDPRVTLKGVISSKSYMIMQDLTESKTAQAISVKDKRKATQKLETFGFRGMKNIAYYFGVVNADSYKDEDELFTLLIDQPNGILVQPENIQRFLNYNSNDFNTQLAINTSRAIEKGIIEKRSESGAGDSYFINNHPVGKSESDVIIYLESNEDLYSTFIVEKLGDEAEKEKEIKKEEQGKQIETIDIEGLRAKAKDLFEKLKDMGVKGATVSRYAQIVSPEKMQAAIADAEELISKRAEGKEIVLETSTEETRNTQS